MKGLQPRCCRLVAAAISILIHVGTGHVQADDLDPVRDKNRTEVNALPMLMGDTDRGVILSAAGVVVRFQEGSYPYHWRLSVLAQLSVERRTDDTLQFPFHHDRVRLELPGVFHPKLRLDFEAAYRRYTDSGYYGFGNAADDVQTGLVRYNEYDRIHPGLSARARFRFSRSLELLVGASFTYNWINLYTASKLAADLQSDDLKIRGLLKGTSNHALTEFTLGWLYDTRDHEFWPTRGGFHELSWRFSPGLEYLFGGVNLTARFFRPLWRGEKLVLGARITADMLFGDVPLYELSRVGGLQSVAGVGGGRAIRGIPLQRYHGKLKLLANLELRSKLMTLSLLGQRFALGALAFFDAGRIWTSFNAPRQFDGSGLGLKMGMGGGARVQWGETFIMRFDLAWSPDSDPLGFYVGLNHIF